jgi:hypothetical protein
MALNLSQAFANVVSLPVNAVRGVGRAVFGPGHQPLRELGAGMRNAFAQLPGSAQPRSRTRRATPMEEGSRSATQMQPPSARPQSQPPGPSRPKTSEPIAPASVRTPSRFYDGSSAEARAGEVTVNGNTYKFISGGHKRGYIPEGEYGVSSPRLRSDAGFTVGDFGFSFNLDDRYDSRVGDTRSELRIHPDGGSCGTAGCMGIQGDEKTQRQFYADMRKELESGNNKVKVSYFPSANEFLSPRKKQPGPAAPGGNPFLTNPLY